MAQRHASARRPFALALSAPLLGALVALGCPGAQQREDSGEPITVKLRRVEVADASFETLGLLVIVAVQNPSSRDLSLAGGDVSLAIEGKSRAPQDDEDSEEGGDSEDDEDNDDQGSDDAATASPDDADDDEAADADVEAGADEDTSGIVTGQRFTGDASSGVLPAFKETEVPIRVDMPLPKDPHALERLLSWQRMNLDVSGALRIGGRTETFAGMREVATPILPRIVLQESQVASVDGGQKGAVFFSVGIDNPNSFPIAVDRFTWGAAIGDKQLRELGEGDRESVPPASVASFEDTLQLNEETFGSSLRALLTKPRVPYRIEGYYEIRGIRRPFVFEGEMEFAR